MCFLPRGSILSFEGGILLSISLGLAVRIFWSDLEKCPKLASGKILGRHLRPGTFLWQKRVPEKNVLWRNDFVVGGGGILPDQNEFYGRWDTFGCSNSPKTMIFHYLVGISSFPGK